MPIYNDGVLASGQVASLAASSITASVIAANAIGAAEIAANAIDADSLATDAVAEIVNAVLDETLDTDHDTVATLGAATWRMATKTVTFTGAAGAGEIGTVNVFTISGDVEIAMEPVKCTTNLAGAATLQLGVTGTATLFSAFWATFADASTFDAGEWWGGTTGSDGTPGGESGSGLLIAASGANVILTVAAANVTDGVLVFYLWWRPLSAGATLVAA